MVWPAAIALGVGTIASGLLGSKSAKDASKAQAGSEAERLAFEREAYEDASDYRDERTRIADRRFKRFTRPRLRTGNQALQDLAYRAGIGPMREGYTDALRPGEEFAINEAQRGLEASAGARGGLLGGNALTAINDRRMAMADNMRTNALARLAGFGGQAPNPMVLAPPSTAGVSGAFQGQGDARAAGIVGQGNAWTNAINQGATLGGWLYGQQTPAAGYQPYPMTTGGSAPMSYPGGSFG